MSIVAIHLLAHLIAGLLCAIIAYGQLQSAGIDDILSGAVAFVLVRWWVMWLSRIIAEFFQKQSLDYGVIEGSTRAVHIGVFALMVIAGALAGIVAKEREGGTG